MYAANATFTWLRPRPQRTVVVELDHVAKVQLGPLALVQDSGVTPVLGRSCHTDRARAHRQDSD
jgi:hypothetical protein